MIKLDSQMIKQANERVALIQERIILANEEYQKYNQKGIDCTLNDFCALCEKIDGFYKKDISSNRFDPFGMYKLMKNHKYRYCRKAVKEMDKLLAEKGIYANKMLDEYNGTGREILIKVEAWEVDMLSCLANYDLSLKEKDYIIKQFVNYVKDLKSQTLCELLVETLPTGSEFVEKQLQDYHQQEKEY